MAAEWVGREMETLDLGDPRRNRRVIRMIEQFFEHPGASIPDACGSWADTKAAYRALGSEEIAAGEILRAHACAAVERMRGLERVLVVQDTTALSFNTRPATEGLGPLTQAGTRGLLVHSGLAVTPDGLPLGLVHQQVWARDEDRKRHTRRKRLVEEKESFRWLEMVDATESLLPMDQEVWVAGDREADLFELFAMQRRPGMHLVVRAAHDRKVESEEAEYLLEAAERAPVLGEMEVAVPRSRKRQARTARLRVQACTLKLVPPRNHLGRKGLPPIQVSVVRVRETETTPEGEEPVEWLIVTTVPVSTLARAVEIVEAYAQRWKIERYHYVLKSGCGIEKLQLESADRIERALAIYTVVAWRLLYMTYVTRLAPDLPCTAVLEDDEWRALFVAGSRRRKPVPEQAPTVREAVRMIAMLGGFLGRKGDGEPGIKVIWRGFRRLMDFTLALRSVSHTHVGNG